ncbi:Probable WRKY transcription factor 20 [Striga hermonthica]|uniref:Probable WRKY transcription factor 20 n=1 Tax=Striga hermonthica TaxID=68872 RepID=A0A9N7MT13_STRHE|nr:Probable WRKY transcription factor 20 [Striga hermonthica]
MANSNSLHSQQSPSDYAPAAADRVTDAAGSGNVAKYRLMSPAKLPISRSTCISVPPGLSRTSFLESPILLSNIKAEPSPTTGSFFKRQWMRGSGENAAFSIGKIISSENTVDERMTSSFEFRFQTGVSSTSGISSAGLSIGQVNQHNQRYSLSPAPSALASQAVAGDLQDASVVGSTTDELNQGHSHTGILESSSEHKDSISSISAEKTSDDGYNWRKYGQKLVKGSEFPRSYYKCTYPNCEAKKIFERSPSGQITEIVYKGSHDHPKPQAPRRHNLGALLPIQENKLDKGLSISDQEGKLNATNMEQNGSPMFSPLQANKEENDCSDSQFQGLNDNCEADDPFLKRRYVKMEDSLDVTPVVKPIREPRVVVQTVSEVDILDDGYRWRKYGQKVVRGNPNPRSYYKCTHSGCPVRKHVERASHDPKAVITTYEGKHNHDVPTAKNSSNECAGIPRMRPQDGGSVCLDLDVGVGRSTEIRTNEQLQALDDEAVRNQIGTNDSRTMAARGSQIPPICYGRVNGGLNLYGNRENHVADGGFQTPSIHPSNQCQQNLGSIILGP